MSIYNLKVSAASIAKEGRNNQDNLLIDKYVSSISEVPVFSCEIYVNSYDKFIAAVSDGVGGCSCGERASALVVETVQEYLRQINYNDTTQTTEECFNVMNERVVTDTMQGGATASLIVLEDDELYVFNIGDSPIMISRHGGRVKILSQDHTLSNDKNIFLNKKENQDSNILTHYVGNYELSGAQQLSSKRIKIKQDDIIIVCSDGIVKGLTSHQIKKLLKTNPQNPAKTLVEAANANGANDDITAIVIMIDEMRK